MYDVDLFDTPQATIAQIQANGRKVICYFSGGSYENWRNDEGDFPSNALGNPLAGWSGEKWLDIRSEAVKKIMRARLDLAQQKGCDGVEPDNMDGYTNNPDFPLTVADQLVFNRFMADEAHARHLSVGLKNDLDQVTELVSYFYFAVNEQCFAFDECDLLTPFISAGKAVFNTEYKASYVNNATVRATMCTDALNRSFSTLVLPLALNDSFRHSCN